MSEYINQNKERWEKRENERKEKIIELEKDWEKMGRFEKIEYLKKKYKNKIPEKNVTTRKSRPRTNLESMEKSRKKTRQDK